MRVLGLVAVGVALLGGSGGVLGWPSGPSGPSGSPGPGPGPEPAARRAQSCNGSPALCGRAYSNVTFVGAHDSAFVGILPTDNQYVSVAAQLSLGYRFLQAQSHDKDGVIELCHTTCLEKDAGTLAGYLATVRAFLDAHPDEVVTLLLTNGDAIPVAQFGAVFAAAGLDAYAFAPGRTLALDEWPTLGALVARGQRLVVFMDYHADTAQVGYILDEFAYLYETPYDTTDPDFAECVLDRPAGASASGRMGLVNHFLDVEIDVFSLVLLLPYPLKAADTNSVASIAAQAALCTAAHGRPPNFVLLDFVSIGAGLEAQDQLNGV